MTLPRARLTFCCVAEFAAARNPPWLVSLGNLKRTIQSADHDDVRVPMRLATAYSVIGAFRRKLVYDTLWPVAAVGAVHCVLPVVPIMLVVPPLVWGAALGLQSTRAMSLLQPWAQSESESSVNVMAWQQPEHGLRGLTAYLNNMPPSDLLQSAPRDKIQGMCAIANYNYLHRTFCTPGEIGWAIALGTWALNIGAYAANHVVLFPFMIDATWVIQVVWCVLLARYTRQTYMERQRTRRSADWWAHYCCAVEDALDDPNMTHNTL